MFVISLRETSGQMSRLREKVDEVNWTVGAVNHTVSNDISIHHLKIQDLQVQINIGIAKLTFIQYKHCFTSLLLTLHLCALLLLRSRSAT